MCQSSRLQKAAGKLKVVRDGMSILEPEQQNGLSRVTCSTHLNESLCSLVVVSVVSLGRSIPHYAPTRNTLHDQLAMIEGLIVII